ncbi:BTAD domain-containing putative transcriptional regulator [Isoptericola sp. NPDC057653]|uniref:AfsR/SARP family transcriptional regulator n=1 Tax=Isoptericola sp. NPDC057653 TaxID=3346195 RepID=UPI0036B6DFD0
MDEQEGRRMVTVGVLGPVVAWGEDGAELALRGPRHRELLARLVAARGRVVGVTDLVDDLWEDPPDGAVAAVRTFVAALRRALEPDRPPRAAPRVLVTQGPGYALRLPDDAVDARAAERLVSAAAAAPAATALRGLDAALALWRGEPYAGIDAAWAASERARLEDLRLGTVEQRAEALLVLDSPADVVAGLERHVATQPWREEGWRLLALALRAAGRQADALAVVRRARRTLVDELGLDPGPRLAEAEARILRQEDGAGADLWARAADTFARTASQGPARLEQSATLLGSAAVTGGLAEARDQRSAVVRAADRRGDPRLTARVLDAVHVPSVWPVPDDPAEAAVLAQVAERTLRELGPDAPDRTRARLLAGLATELRGARGGRGPEAAREAVALARRTGDPATLARALGAQVLHTVGRAGLAPARDALGAELVDVAARAGLATDEIVGRLVRVQARTALGDVAGAAGHAEAARLLAADHERPLVEVLVTWAAVVREAVEGAPDADVVRAVHEAAARLPGAGMEGLEAGLEPLAVLSLRVGRGCADAGALAGATGDPADPGAVAAWGPYRPWVRPWALHAAGRGPDAARALAGVPDPPPGLLAEALWVLAGRAAVLVGDRTVAGRARAALAPAVDELAAGSALVTAGSVAVHLGALDAFLAGDPPVTT